jgi:hypothetical protein
MLVARGKDTEQPNSFSCCPVTPAREIMIPLNGTNTGSIPGLSAAPEMLNPYPRDLNVKDPAQPFVIFPGMPNEHLMIPVHSQELATGSRR